MTADKLADSTPWLVRHARLALDHRWGRGLAAVARRLPFVRRLWTGLAVRGKAERDLKHIDALALPRNEKFFARKDAAYQIDGMFSHLAMAIIDTLLTLQDEAGIAGSMLEFGVYKGRSASLLGRHLHKDERLVLVDIADYLDPRAVAPFEGSVDFLLSPAKNFRAVLPQYGARKGSFRFIHVDASHGFRATFDELKIADELLARRGLIAMDDFANLYFSQNIAAIFKYLYSSGTSLTLLLVTDEKAYLCRKSERAFYAGFVLDRLIAEIESRGVTRVCVARTDEDPDYRAFYVGTQLEGEDSRFYGPAIYRNYFQSP